MSVIPASLTNLQSAPPARRTIQGAILEALTYSEIFDHPLRLDELHRYLPVPARMVQVSMALESMHDRVHRRDDCFFLLGQDSIVDLRREREARSRRLLPRAIRYGSILGALPFIRMVALTGSLAVLNVSKNADFDYMLVTAKGRVWTARAFALLLNRLVRPLGSTICPNLIVSETALEWPLHDLYSARELVQMIPISGFDIYRKLMNANEWARDFLPNAGLSLRGATGGSDEAILRKFLKRWFEFPLQSKPGNRFETWEMTRKIARFSKQPGFGEETVFNAEVCQGNFHQHRKWTRMVFEGKLRVIASAADRNEAIPSSMDEIASSPVGSSQ